MPVNKKLHKSLKKFSNQKEEKLITISGELGLPLNGQMLVDVPNREGFVFVRLRNNTSEVIQAYNSEVSNSYGLPVLVARQNNIYKIIGRDQERYRDWGNTPYLPKHGGQHSFNNELGMGADVAWIYSPQFMPLLVYPSGSSGSPTLQVAPYPVRDLSGNWKYVGNTGTPSTLPYNPTTGSRAIMALVYLDTVSGNPLLLVNSGTYFSDSLTGTNQVAPYIPRLNDPNGIPLAAIRLLSGTSTLTWNNLYDVRPFLQVFPTGSSGSSVNPPITGSVVYQDDYVTKGSALVFNFRNGLIATASGTNAQIDVDFGTGTNQVPYANHNHQNGNGATLKSKWVYVAHGLAGSVPASSTYYAFMGSNGLSAINLNTPIPITGTLKNLAVRVVGTQPASGSLVFMVVVGAVDTGITVTAAAGSTTATLTDTTNTYPISSGGTINFRIVNNATAASIDIRGMTLEIEFNVTS